MKKNSPIINWEYLKPTKEIYEYENILRGSDAMFAPYEVVFKDPRNVKLKDPITYFDDGTIIPLHLRDNFTKNDIRFKNGGKINANSKLKRNK